MWCPPRHPPLPRHPLLQCGVSWKGGTTCGVPHVPPFRVVPPYSVVSPGRVGQHVVSPVSSPLARVIPPFSVVSPRSSVVSPYVVPPSASSPLARVVPPFSVVSPRSSVVSPYVVPPSVSSPLTRVVPPFSVVSPGRVGQHVVSPASSPPSASSPPTVWCLLEGWDNMWCPPRRPPFRVVPPYSVVSPGRVGQHVVSPVVPTVCDVPCCLPCVWSPLLSPQCVVSPCCPPLSVVSPGEGDNTRGDNTVGGTMR